MTPELEKKVQRAIKLLQATAPKDGSPVEVAYSGGKDSDVILQLAKEAGINYRAIYKNTTIDPPGTIAHAKAMGAEVLKPKQTFREIMIDAGFPNRFKRFCCNKLKEYKVLDKSIMGVRKAESTKRASRYSEPTECRFYGSKKQHVEAIYPILEWTDDDVRDFILDRGIKCAPVYYDEHGTFHVERRLGCMCCPMAYYKKRIQQFKEHPRMVRLYLKAGQQFRERHTSAKQVIKYSSVYEWFVRDVFFEREPEWQAYKHGLFGEIDYKEFLERQFNIDLTL